MIKNTTGKNDNKTNTSSEITSIGEIMYNTMCDEVMIESEKWALERVETILQKFRTHCDLDKDYKVVIPWVTTHTAFTAPGDYIFISRKLFQECPLEEMVALIIAHEISHHTLGHLDKIPAFFKDSTANDLKIFTAALYRVVETRIHGPELECDADRNALEMCIQAGYDPHRCLKIFDKMEKMALDMGDIKSVYGPDEADDELLPDAPTATKIKIWLYQRKHGYLPIRDRREMLLQHLKKMGIN